MSQNLEELIQQAKVLNPIEQVVQEDAGFTLNGHGRYYSCKEHDSLVIDTHNQTYYWNSTGECGDVISWIEHRNNWDFKSTIEYLCKRAGLAAPEWGAGSPGKRLAARERQDVFELAADVFARWLWNDVEALGYARSRGWTDETIRRARLGFSGGSVSREDLKEELKAAIVTSGGDPHSAAAVALLGFSGDVRQWMVDRDMEVNPDWVESKRIPGLIGRGMLLYPHYLAGRCGYFSGRGVKEKVHYNLPVPLVGDKQIYANWEWSTREEQTVLVEGQADAVTLAQWGIPAVAFCGVHADEHLARFLGVGDEHRNVAFSIGLDADKAGKVNTNKLARLFGPMTRMINWAGIGGIDTWLDSDGIEHEVKDSNDLLRGMSR